MRRKRRRTETIARRNRQDSSRRLVLKERIAVREVIVKSRFRQQDALLRPSSANTLVGDTGIAGVEGTSTPVFRRWSGRRGTLNCSSRSVLLPWLGRGCVARSRSRSRRRRGGVLDGGLPPSIRQLRKRYGTMISLFASC